MNGGEAEKEQAARVKRLIKSNKRSRKEPHQSTLVQIDMPEPLLGLLTPFSPTESRASQPQTISQDMSCGSSSNWTFDNQNFPCDFTDMEQDVTFLDVTTHESFSSQTPFEATLFSLDGKSRARPPLSIHTDNLSTIHPSLLSETDEAPMASSIFANSKINHQYLSGGSEPGSCSSNSDSQESSADHVLENQQNSTSKVPEHPEPRVQNQTSFGNSILDIGERPNEAKYFMHYLDRVFYVVFPFYNSSGNEEYRAWVLNLLMQDRPVYYAALALGQYHFHYSRILSVEIEHDNKSNREGEEYHNLALRDLQDAVRQTHTWDRSKCLIRRVQALTCSLHLLFFEV